MGAIDIDALLAAAHAAERAGDTAAATRHYAAALARDDGHAGALNGFGLLRLYAGDADEAAAMLARATAADPGAAMLWLNLSSAHRSRGDAGQERAALAAAINLDPYLLPALIRRAELHERLGEDGPAAAAWGSVLAAAPPDDGAPPALRQVLDHARAFARDRGGRFAAALDAAMAGELAGVDGAERRRMQAALDAALGRRRIFANDCAGLHFPFLPADEYHDAARFPWFARLEAATPAIRTELAALLSDRAGVEPYVDMPSGMAANKWSPLNKSVAWGAYFLWRLGERRDDACARCPATAATVEALPRVDIPGRAPTAFFSLLEPRTRIPAHTGVTNTRVTVHLPLIVPPGCAFRVGGDTRPWVEGRAWAFDDTIEHEAWNDSDELRAILIVDAWNPYLTPAEQALIRAFYVAADATGLNPEVASTG